MSSASLATDHSSAAPTSPDDMPLFDAHDKQYLLVAVGLAIMTAVEVALSYAGLEKASLAMPLLALAAVKFIVVAAFFMHLKNDTPLFRRMFIMGAVLAGFCYIGVLSAFGVLKGGIQWLLFGGFAIVILAVWVFAGVKRAVPDEHLPHDFAGHDHAH
jgi:cytochrome c oxidase subunit IV